MAAGSAVRTFFCCWADLLHGQACCVYNVIFAPFIITMWATWIYCCACVSLYCKRTWYLICCCPCRKLGCCWLHTDKKFPPTERSLGNVGGDSANKASGKTSAKCAWVRAGEMSKGGKMQLFSQSIRSKVICQGALGDCWLLAAMACLAEHPGAIAALFTSRERNPRGKYRVRLFDANKNEWVKLTIDDHVPCDANSLKNGKAGARPLFTQPNGNELWVMLLEKAFAKFCGSYAALEGGDTVWAIQAMTGDPARMFKNQGADKGGWKRLNIHNEGTSSDRRKAYYTETGEIIGQDAMFDILLKYDQLGSVMSASGASGVGGLITGHAYSILTLKKLKSYRLVKIRNPWGTGEWTGDWSDKSRLWDDHVDVKRACGYTKEDDGAFWMSWEDFIRNWSSVGVVDRTIDIRTVTLHVAEDTGCGPAKACVKGCCSFCCGCVACSRLYCPHHSSEETVKAGNKCCLIM